MSNASNVRVQYRAVLAGDRCVHPANVYDPVSALVALKVGFTMLMLPGSLASAAVLGAPDDVVLSLTEFAEQARRITRVSSVPLMVDADHGYGNALNVKRTIVELQAAGVAAATIEDTLLPEAFGAGGVRFVSIDEGMGKMRAAVAARTDPGFTIIARTGSAGLVPLEETVARAKAYEACGVDGLFFARLSTRAELDALSAATTVPILVGNVPPAIDDIPYLESRRVRVCLQGHAPFLAAVQAIFTTLGALKAGTLPRDLPGLASTEFVDEILREDRYQSDKTQYLNHAR